jgi:hypothetical protein
MTSRRNWLVSYPGGGAKTFYRKTEHTYESRGCGDLFIWFGGTLNKSFHGPVICHPLFPTTIRLLLAPIDIKPVSNFFLVSLWTLRNYCFVQMSSSIFSCTVLLYKVFGGGGRCHAGLWGWEELRKGGNIDPKEYGMYKLVISFRCTLLLLTEKSSK